MIIIKFDDSYKIISNYELQFYLNNSDSKVLGTLKGDYPSIKCMKIKDRTFKNVSEIIALLKKKILEQQKKMVVYENQLNDFVEDIEVLGVK